MHSNILTIRIFEMNSLLSLRDFATSRTSSISNPKLGRIINIAINDAQKAYFPIPPGPKALARTATRTTVNSLPASWPTVRKNIFLRIDSTNFIS